MEFLFKVKSLACHKVGHVVTQWKSSVTPNLERCPPPLAFNVKYCVVILSITFASLCSRNCDINYTFNKHFLTKEF